jgi:DNA primase
MGSNTEAIKERLDIADVIAGYIKVEKAGSSYKACCPFHNEKTPSFFISPGRQSYYCFGCGAKGDIFTFVEEMEGLDFRGALRSLADKAGIELEQDDRQGRGEKDRLHVVLSSATEFFEKHLGENKEVQKYLKARGVDEESMKKWRLGYAPAEWRSLWAYLKALGFSEDEITKAGLAKKVVGDARKEPYDTFRDRIIFPIFDTSGEVIAFSGRAFAKDGIPKYLNSPEGPLFKKSEVLYGLDRAKAEIRKKDYAVLVEGQLDLVLSHQAGVKNAVATSGTAFTQLHLDRLKRLSQRIILAFDGDEAGEKASEKSAVLALSMGMEVKIADMPEGKDPADLASKDVDLWREVLKRALPAPEFFLSRVLEEEREPRKLGRLILKRVLPVVALVSSSIERAHFVSVIAKRSGIKEESIWEDLRGFKTGERTNTVYKGETLVNKKTHEEKIKERLEEIKAWRKELPQSAPELDKLAAEEEELVTNLKYDELQDKLAELIRELSQAEAKKDEKSVTRLTQKVADIHKEIRALE